MPHPGNKLKIPLPEDEVLRALLKVKPTADMPRPGASNTGSKPKQHWIKKGKTAACGAIVPKFSGKNERSKVTCQSCLAFLAKEDLRKQQTAMRQR